ncbi:MAG TPA: MFS transporter [Burkholderiales bacterium]
MRLWFARVAGNAGSQMLLLALGWQMYNLTGSAWDLGLVGLLQFLPALLLVLVAGHVVDRHQRAHVMALCLACQAGIAAMLCALSLQGAMHREWLLIISVALGTLRAFQMPAQQALTPSLVPAELLPRALAFSSSGMQAAIIAGPALGGALYVAGAEVTYAACTLLCVAASALCATIRYQHVPPAGEMSIATLLAGLRFVAARKVVLGAVSLDLFAVLLGGATALLPMYAKDVLDVGPGGLGLLRSAPAAGALAMSLALTRWPVRRRTGHRLLAAVAVYGVTMVVFGWSTDFALSLTALAVGGAADMISVVIRQTLVQLETPNDMRGRVSAVNSVFIGASNQLGEFESGATAAWFGLVESVVLGGIGTCLVAVVWWRLFPDLAQRDRLLANTSAPPRA